MAKQLLMQKRGMYLAPADTASKDVIMAMAHNEIVGISMVRPRNIKHHRKFFAMIGEVFKAQETFVDQDDMLDAIKIAIGHRKQGNLADGTVYYSPKSINFASMDQSAFELFYDRFLDYCLRVIIPGVNKPEFEMHLLSIIDGRDYEGMQR